MALNIPDKWATPDEYAPGFDARPVTGEMASYMGHQYTANEIWQFKVAADDIHSEEEAVLRPRSHSIRAFDIPSLAHVEVQFNRLVDVRDKLVRQLALALPCVQWNALQKISTSRIKKYGLLHETVLAPLDETTQEAMLVEVVGHVQTRKNQAVGLKWFHQIKQSIPAESQVREDELELGTVMLLSITTTLPAYFMPILTKEGL